MSNQFAQDLQQVEMDIEDAKEMVELHACLKRLKDNPDFDKLISVNFLEKEAYRVVGAKADISVLMNEVTEKMMENIIISIGGLRQYFLKVQMQGQQAAVDIAASQETHAELLVEQAASEE